MFSGGIVTVMVGEADPLGWVRRRAVHEALHDALARAAFPFPLHHLDSHQGTLVHVWAAFKLIQELQHLVVNRVNLPSNVVSCPRDVQHVRNVVFSCYHQWVLLRRAAPSLEFR